MHEYSRRGFFAGLLSGLVVSAAALLGGGFIRQLLLFSLPGLLFAGLVVLPWCRAAGYARTRTRSALLATAVAFPIAALPTDLLGLEPRLALALCGLLGALLIWSAVNGPRAAELGPFATVGVFAGLAFGFRAQLPWLPDTVGMMACFALWQSSIAYILRRDLQKHLGGAKEAAVAPAESTFHAGGSMT